MNEYWHLFYWKGWYDSIYRNFITAENIVGKGTPKQYDKVFTFDEETGKPVGHFINPKDYQKVIHVRKDRYTYMLPCIFEDKLPLKPTEYLECLEKPSNKNVYRYIKGVTSVNVPADKKGQSFNEFIDGFNPIEHTNPLHNTLMKLMVFASGYKGIGICVCSAPEFGKGVNFSLLKYTGSKVIFMTDPTKAFLYQGLLTNRILVFDEMTTCKSDSIREIETTIKKLKDNTPEMPKQALQYGNQKSEVDLRRTSAIFTYNRPQDLKNREKSFEDIWGNPGAIFSRLPRFLFEGRVNQSMDNPNDSQIDEAVDNGTAFFKDVTMKSSYWVKNLHSELKGWGRSGLDLTGRHYTNAEGWIDAIEAYCQTEQQFQSMLKEVNRMKRRYLDMIQGKNPIETLNDITEEIL